MTDYYQETDSKTMPTKFLRRFALKPVDKTIGREGDSDLYTSATDSELVAPVRRVIFKIRNEELAKDARVLVSAIQEAIKNRQQAGIVLDHLPPLKAFNVDDGSILIEWAFPDFRVGFSVEPISEQSSWYLVSNKKLGDIGASGYFSSGNLRSLIPWLLSFILSNS